MNFSKEGLALLIALTPGFLFIKIVMLRTGSSKLEMYEYFVDSLISAIVIYAIAQVIRISVTIENSYQLFLLLTLTLILGLLWSEIINQDLLSKLLQPGLTKQSTQSSIYPHSGINKFKYKWHLIRFSNGHEVVGIISEYNNITHEMLVKDGRLVKGGSLSKESAWYYVPSGDNIIYMRTLEDQNSSNERKK